MNGNPRFDITFVDFESRHTTKSIAVEKSTVEGVEMNNITKYVPRYRRGQGRLPIPVASLEQCVRFNTAAGLDKLGHPHSGLGANYARYVFMTKIDKNRFAMYREPY
ncbi:hypothetical protein EVAR_53213_1 [Eumeta japonica]|uniref:Uncharacterized protein n=1 Tax=Eumeta variegata TaxID=151549 RepID=A0A4C1XDW7_EUMVA|nr:hypothetical protein EVAR_53213_1 [Eumeta japonica]